MTEPSPIRLSDLAGAIRNTLDQQFGNQTYWVLAEVANHKFYAQRNHHYFDLVEKGQKYIITKCSAVAWLEGDRRIRVFERLTGQAFGNDIQVLACVSVEFHVVYGLKLTLHDIDARFTLGQLEEQRQKTLERLLSEEPGLVWKEDDRIVSANSRLRLPMVVQHIAIIASENSAGYEDFMDSFSRHGRGYAFSFEPYFTRVQGADHAENLADRLYEIRASGIQYDAVVIIRGGGAQTDLLIFDQYAIAKAVAAMPIPVITGIGHLRNQTITDMLAHTVTKTPTECAEFIIQRNRAFEDALRQLQQAIVIRTQQLMASHDREISSLKLRINRNAQLAISNYKNHLLEKTNAIFFTCRNIVQDHQLDLKALSTQVARDPQQMLRQQLLAIRHIRHRLCLSVPVSIERIKSDIDRVNTVIQMSSPEKILKRGFALLRAKGQIINQGSKIQEGSDLSIEMHDALIHTVVVTKKPKHE